MEGGTSKGITSVGPMAVEKKLSGSVDRAMPKTERVLIYSPNTRDDYISSLGKPTSHYKKLDAPGNKPETTVDVPDSKGAAVTDAKGAAYKKIPAVSQD